MLINKLKLTNFRNYTNFELDFGKTTVIIGPNGIGKTNILEALFVLATTKSFRTRNEINLFNYGKEYLKISAQIENQKNNDGRKQLVDFFIFQKNEMISKKIKIDDLEKKPIELLGLIKIVLFSPESLQIIIGPPAQRRKFLDWTLMQIDSSYAVNLIGLKKIIIQRNGLLKTIKEGKNKPEELEFWDKKLIEYGTPIIIMRIQYLDFVNKNIVDYYQKVSGEKIALKINYQTNIINLDKYGELLAANREKEIFLQKTLYSPHLDDFLIKRGNNFFREVSSRGEIRSLVVAMKMLEADYLESVNHKKAVILLDDVFSELDQKRAGKILELIRNRQSIITATEINDIKKIGPDVKIIDLGGE